MSEIAATPERSSLDTFFRFGEHRTTLRRDTIAGVTTFIVMSYIIFVNPAKPPSASSPGSTCTTSRSGSRLRS